MERLTSNKPADSMPMIELAHNSCYVDKNNTARYRDYNLDIGCRELARNLINDMCDEDLSYMSDEEFDEYVSEMLSVEIDSQIGLLAVFYRNLWAMAELREKLKEYEDLEEQGRLVILPCKIGDTVWKVEEGLEHTYIEQLVIDRIEVNDSYIYYFADEKITGESVILDDCDFSKTVFLTKSKAEAKLKELRGSNEQKKSNT